MVTRLICSAVLDSGMSISEGVEVHLLYVDDDPDQLSLAEKYVESGYEDVSVSTTTDASEVLKRLDSVDCVVSDYEMPEMDGLELLERVRSTHPHLPFILFTGRGTEEVASDAVSAGVTDYVRKGGPEKLDLLARRARRAAKEAEVEMFEARTSQSPFSVIDRVSDAFFALDRDWRFTYVNSATEDMFDAPEEELLGESIWDVAPEGKDTPFYTEYRDAMEEGDSRMIQEYFEPWDRWFREHLYPSEDGLSVITRDVSEEVGREQELHRYEAFVENSYDIITHVDLDGIVHYQSPSLERVLGHEPQEMQGDDIFSYIHPEDREILRDEFGELVEGDEEHSEFVEFRFRHVDGGYRWLEAVGTDQTDEEHGGVIVNSRDVTARRRRTELLREKERLYQAVFDDPNILSAVLDADGALTDVNGNALEYVEAAREDIVGRKFWKTPWWQGYTDVESEMRDLVERAAEGEYVEYEVEHHGEGTLDYVSAGFIRPVEDDEGRVEKLFVSARDVTERRRQQKEIEVERERYEALLDAAPDAVFVVSSDSLKVKEINDTAEEMTGLRPEDVVGENLLKIHPESQRDSCERALRRAIESDSPVEGLEGGVAIEVVDVAGARTPVSVSAASVETHEGSIVKVVYRDVSRERRYRRALEGLNDSSIHLLEADSREAVAEAVSRVGSEYLGLDTVRLYLFDEEEAVLKPVQYGDESTPEESIEPGESTAWKAFTEGKAALFGGDDGLGVADGGGSVAYEAVYPVGGYGSLWAGVRDEEGFEEMELELFDTLASDAEAALDRVEKTGLLQRERDLSRQQAAELERVNSMNEEIRKLISILLEARHRDVVLQQACESIGSLDGVESVWICDRDYSGVGMNRVAGSGSESFLREMEAVDSGLERRALDDRDAVVLDSIAGDRGSMDWCDQALVHGYRSAAAFPIVYGELVYGALGVYSCEPRRFSDLTREVLAEFGEMLGYALHSIEQREALMSDGEVELVFAFPEHEDVFTEVADGCGCTLLLRSSVERPDGSHLVYLDVESGDAGEFEEEVMERGEFKSVRRVEDVDGDGFEVVVIGDVLVESLARFGVKVVSVEVGGDATRATVRTPKKRDYRKLVDVLDDEFGGADVIRKRGDVERNGLRDRHLLESLTDRQRDVLRTAYLKGYFDRDRKVTGAEVAESLGVSQPTFSTQIRAAQHHILEALFDETKVRSLSDEGG